MYKPEFKVVTLVLVILTSLGVIANLFRSRIPPVVNNSLITSEDDFLRRAAYQPVDWKYMNAANIAEAKRAEKPILVLVGVSTSGLVSDLDSRFFSDREVAAFLNLNYTCIRIDGINDPAWLSSYFPISRLKLEFQPGFQMWVLHPSGSVIDFISRSSNRQVFTNDALLEALVALRRSYDQIESGTDIAKGEVVQQNDLRILEEQTEFQIPAFERYRAELVSRVDEQNGGLPREGIQQVFPSAWRFMLATGDKDPLSRSLDPFLTSPMVDLIDGGFFRISTQPDYTAVVFNKLSTETAEMLTLLAQLSLTDPKPIYGFLANLSFNSLEERVRVGDLLSAMQVEAVPRSHRSPRYSYTVRRLREILTPSQRSFATTHLGLDVLQSRQMSPYLTTPEVVTQPELSEILRRLRAEDDAPRNLSSVGYLEVEAVAAARMIEAARLMGGQRRLRSALRRSTALAQFGNGAELIRKVGSGSAEPAYLGDYLAYADAKLQDFLVTGNAVAIQDGLKRLAYAEQKFRGSRPGEYVLSPDPLPLPNTANPEVVDIFRESCTARMMRLCLAYGRLFSHRQDGERLLGIAQEIMGHFGGIAPEGGPEVAAYFTAAADAVDGRYAVAVGPQAEELATELARKRPLRFVAPAVGVVRPDLQDLAPGIYIVRGNVTGPYDAEEAARRLPAAFDVFTASAQPAP